MPSILEGVFSSSEDELNKMLVSLVGMPKDQIESELSAIKSRVEEVAQTIPTKGNKGDKGDKGDQGIQGPKGEPGRDGRDGFIGKDGKQGIDGKDGKDGKDGVSIVDVNVAFDNHLVVTLSDGTEIDAGVIGSIGDNLQNVVANYVSNGANGTLIYKGLWNASTNTPTLSLSSSDAGAYYVVSVAGSTNLSGITDWQVNDWAIFNGTEWQKIDNSDLFNPSAVAITGGSINGTTIGATTASTGKFTSVTTPSVTASSTDLTLSAISTGAVKFNTANGTGMTVVNPASTVANYWEVAPAVSGVGIGLYARGTDASVAMNYLSKGSFGHFFSTGGTYMPQAVVSHTASAVNYVQVTGGATGNNPTISAQGSDTNISLALSPKGTGLIQLSSATNIARNSYNWMQIAGGAATGNAPSINALGTDTNIDLTLTAKGSGQIKATNASNSILSINSTGAYGALQISSATGNNNYIFGYINNTEVGRVTMNSSNQISFATSSAATEQFRILHTASAVNYVSLYGSTTGNSGGPVIIPGGSDAAIPLTISTKSYGSLILNKNRDATNTSQYLMNNVGGLTTDGSGGAFWRGFHQGGITYTVSGVNQFIRLASYHELNSLTDPTTKNWYLTLGNTTSPTNLVLANNTGAPIDFRYGAAAGSDLSFRVATPLTTDRNYLQVAGAATTLAPILSAQGSDTNISMAFQPKGTGAIDLAAGSSGVNISNGGTVTALTRTNVGAGYTSVPTITISAPTTAGGVQATASVTSMGINVGNIASGGTGYAVNDEVLVSGGTFTTQARYRVTAVSGGVVTAITSISDPNYQSLPTNPASTTAAIGTGTGLTLNINWAVTGQSITNAGSGYIEQPTVTFSGGGGSGASAYATVGGTSQIKVIGNLGELWNPAGRQVQFGTSGSGTPTTTIQLYNDGFARSIIGGSGNTVVTSGTASNLNFQTNATAQTQMVVAHTASAVNYLNLTGSTTGNRPAFTAQGSDTNIGMNIFTKGGGELVLGGNTREVLVVTPSTSAAANFLQIANAASTGTPVIKVNPFSVDANVNLGLEAKGTGGITGTINSGTFTINRDSANNAIKFTAPNGNMYIQSTGGGVILFNTGDGTPNQMRVTHTASAVNYVQVTGAATGAGATISAQGSDANVSLILTAKAGGQIYPKGDAYFQNTSGATQFLVQGTGSAANYLRVTGAIAGATPSMASVGSDTNIDLTLTPKGTGVVQFGTHTANADTAISGYITIRDAGGTLRKLAVIT